MLKAARLLLVGFVFLLNPQFAQAKVVINEFLVDPSNAQWVELYNRGQDPIDISGWFIDDSGGTEKFTIPQNTTITPGEYEVFVSSSLFNFNKTTPDTVQLLRDTTLEDSYSYEKGPGVNYSYGRDIDGIGTWVVFNSPTKGISNSGSTPLPTATATVAPTSTPISTPTPTKTPEPTKTPTPTKIPTPTKTLTPTKTPTPLPVSASPTTKRVVLGEKKSTKSNTEEVITKKEQKNYPTSVLGVKIKISPTETPTSNQKLTQSSSFMPMAFIGGGAIFLTACGILAFRAYRKREYEQTDSDNE